MSLNSFCLFLLLIPIKKLLSLYTKLSTYAPDFRIEKADWPELFNLMWPNRAFEIKEFRSKISVLLNLLKRYISFTEWEQQANQQELYYLIQLRKRGLETSFESAARRFHKNLDASPYHSAENDYLRYRLADEANALYGQRQLRQFDASLPSKIDYLDLFYLRIRLRESCELLNRQQVLNTAYEPGLFGTYIEQLCQQPELLQQWPALAVYLQIFSCYREPDNPGVYRQLRKLLLLHAGSFSPEEARAMYRHAQNYCIRRINIGKLEYREELFILYDQQLQSKLILDREELDHSDFKNIVTVALHLKKYDWAMQFMEQYRPLVNPDYRENVYHFCMANFHTEQGQFREAIRLLQTVDFTDVFYILSSRTLLIKLYYEMNEMEGLFYALEAFERFLRRNKNLAKSRRESHYRFIQFCRKLGRLQERKHLMDQEVFVQKSARLMSQLQATERLSNLSWLLEKVNTL